MSMVSNRKVCSPTTRCFLSLGQDLESQLLIGLRGDAAHLIHACSNDRIVSGYSVAFTSDSELNSMAVNLQVEPRLKVRWICARVRESLPDRKQVQKLQAQTSTFETAYEEKAFAIGIPIDEVIIRLGQSSLDGEHTVQRKRNGGDSTKPSEWSDRILGRRRNFQQNYLPHFLHRYALRSPCTRTKHTQHMGVSSICPVLVRRPSTISPERAGSAQASCSNAMLSSYEGSWAAPANDSWRNCCSSRLQLTRRSEAWSASSRDCSHLSLADTTSPWSFFAAFLHWLWVRKILSRIATSLKISSMKSSDWVHLKFSSTSTGEDIISEVLTTVYSSAKLIRPRLWISGKRRCACATNLWMLSMAFWALLRASRFPMSFDVRLPNMTSVEWSTASASCWTACCMNLFASSRNLTTCDSASDCCLVASKASRASRKAHSRASSPGTSGVGPAKIKLYRASSSAWRSLCFRSSRSSSAWLRLAVSRSWTRRSRRGLGLSFCVARLDVLPLFLAGSLFEFLLLPASTIEKSTLCGLFVFFIVANLLASLGLRLLD